MPNHKMQHRHIDEILNELGTLRVPFFVGGGYALGKWLGHPITFSDSDVDVFFPTPDCLYATSEKQVKEARGCLNDIALVYGESIRTIDTLRKNIKTILENVRVSLKKRYPHHDCVIRFEHKTSRLKKSISLLSAAIYVSTNHDYSCERLFPAIEMDFIACPTVRICDFLQTTPRQLYSSILEDFDLDICRLGFFAHGNFLEAGGQSVADFPLINKRAAVDATIGVCKRFRVPRDVRRIICSHVSKFEWNFVLEWVSAPSWNELAVTHPDRYPAIMHWKKSSTRASDEFGTFNETAGLERIEKYVKRGFQVADFPARTSLIQNLLTERALKRAKTQCKIERKDKKREERDRSVRLLVGKWKHK